MVVGVGTVWFALPRTCLITIAVIAILRSWVVSWLPVFGASLSSTAARCSYPARTRLEVRAFGGYRGGCWAEGGLFTGAVARFIFQGKLCVCNLC